MSNKLKTKRKPVNNFPLNMNMPAKQLSEQTTANIETLMYWKQAREDEMFEGFKKEFQEKLFKAEDYIAVANILISLCAIRETWGFKKANQRFLDNLNKAHKYVDEKGIAETYAELHEQMGIELEFDTIDIYKEFGINC